MDRRISRRPAPFAPALACALAGAVAWTLGSAPVAAAQERAEGDLLCGDCGTTGRVPRPLPADVVKAEGEGVTYCSRVFELDPENLGIGWAPCPDCRAPSLKEAARVEHEIELEKRRTWLEQRRAEVDALVGTEMLHLETAHYTIAWDIPKITVGRVTLRDHDAVHLYAQRFETLYRELLEAHGITEYETLRERIWLYLFESQRAAKLAAPRLVGRSIMGGTKTSLVGPPRTSMVGWWDKSKFPQDEDFHQSLCHEVSHHIHNQVREYKYWLFDRYGWIYEGLAHWVEMTKFGVPNTWCTSEGGILAHWKGKNWEADVKKALIAGEEPDFQSVMAKSVPEMDARDHVFAWSYVDFLMWYDPHQMDEMLGLMKGPQVPARDALRDAYGLTVGQFIDAWRAFVREHYQMRERKGPIVREPRARPPSGPGESTDG